MSLRLRVDALHLATTGGDVDYRFDGPLTVLTGPVGAGKSTLFEFMKFATGGSARLAPPASTEVHVVRVELNVQGTRLSLERRTDRDADVVIRDMTEGRSIGTFPVARRRDAPGPTVGDFLLATLGLPINAAATSRARSSRITFNSIWSFLYVEQREIDRSIAHSGDSVREPMRKATFELLYGFTDEFLLGRRAALLDAQALAASAERDEATVRRFLADSQTRSREEAIEAFEVQSTIRAEAQSRMNSLQSDSNAVRGEVGVVRQMLSAARVELQALEEARRSQEVEQSSRRQLLSGLVERESQVERGHSAASLLAPINFVTCPRCSQSLRDRNVDDGTCMLCLQPEPTDDSTLQRRATYETERIGQQRAELMALITNGEKVAAELDSSLVVARQNLTALEELLDQRTAAFVSPRLERFVDAASELASASARISELEALLQQWDRVHDLERVSIEARATRDAIASEIERAEYSLAEYKRDMLRTLSLNYQAMVAALGVPAVTEVHIDERSYLPFANGQRFDQLSSGGITTSLVTAYWLTVLATALRERQTSYPTLLLIDTPRKSIGAENSRLADELYRQLSVLAETYSDRMQVIVADNDAPAGISRDWQVMRFDYDSPTIRSLVHPGPNSVITLEDYEG